MNYEAINSAYKEAQSIREDHHRRLEEVTSSIASGEYERDTLHALIAAEDVKIKSLGQHLPQETTPGMVMPGEPSQIRR